VLFALDWSSSMWERDCGTDLTRFQTCMESVIQVFNDQVDDEDLVGVVGFGAYVETVCAPTQKRQSGDQILAKLKEMQPHFWQMGTHFFDGVEQSLSLLRLTAPGAPRWLVCLTDGDDLGSRWDNKAGEQVTKQLKEKLVDDLNMVMITVGQLDKDNVKVIDHWAELVTEAGGIGLHVSQSDAAGIAAAFEVVAEYLAAEVGGATEC